MFKNYLISTGGSGGHVLPATTFYEHLSEEANVVLSTDKRGLKYLDKNKFQIIMIKFDLNFLPAIVKISRSLVAITCHHFHSFKKI